MTNRSQQATMLQQWATEPDASRLPLLQALKCETLVVDSTGQAFVQHNQSFTPLEGQLQPVGTPKKIWLNNRLRILIANALTAQRLASEDESVRLQAALELQQQAQSDQLPLLNQRLKLETDSKVKKALSIALANLQLTDSNPLVRLKAVQLLGQSGSPQTQSRLQSLTDAKTEPDAQVRAAAVSSPETGTKSVDGRGYHWAGLQRVITRFYLVVSGSWVSHHLWSIGCYQYGPW